MASRSLPAKLTDRSRWHRDRPPEDGKPPEAYRVTLTGQRDGSTQNTSACDSEQPSAETETEIDHIFMFVEPGCADLEYLNSLGLVETYRRAHPGQGTQNICYCFDNLFLECLWVSDVAQVRSEVIARTGLYERSRWRTAGTCPFGIAWRTSPGGEAFDPAIWAFRPPYLPAGMSIEVSVDCDDPRQPRMFTAPGATPPLQWVPERRRDLQRSAGLGRVLSIRMEMPWNVEPSAALVALAGSTLLEIQSASTEMPSLTLEVERLCNDMPLVIRLPVEQGLVF